MTQKSLKERLAPHFKPVKEPRSQTIYRLILMLIAVVFKNLYTTEATGIRGLGSLFVAFFIAIYISEKTYQLFHKKFPWITRWDK